MRQKLATQIFYLNAGWNSWWGGCLRILNYAEACGGLLRQISARQPIAARG